MALKVITINPSELYCNSASIIWEDENKEVVYKGKLYDIVSIKNNGRRVELTVVSDEQEMELKKHFASLYDIDSHTTTKGPFSLLKTFFLLKFIVNTDPLEFKAVKTNMAAYFPPLSFNVNHKAIPKDGPPPDLFL